MPAGRPSTISPEIIEEICIQLAEGKSLRKICESSDTLPAWRTVLRWLIKEEHKEFSQQYARAREVQAETWQDEIIEVADEADTSTGAQIAKVRVDARKWAAIRLKPKVDRAVGYTPPSDEPEVASMTKEQAVVLLEERKKRVQKTG